LIFPRYRTVVFVHGCFWHRHRGCQFAYEPKSNRRFWNAKFRANVARDQVVQEAIKAIGWKSITVWECELKSRPATVGSRTAKRIRSARRNNNGMR
jgi:DNA mismatch endonuclease (patch repair protein)